MSKNESKGKRDRLIGKKFGLAKTMMILEGNAQWNVLYGEKTRSDNRQKRIANRGMLIFCLY